MAKLTNRQHERFACEYVSNGFNATKAARSVGYAHNSAHVQGSRLLSDDKVVARVGELADNINSDKIMTAEELLDEMSKMSKFNIKDAYDENGQLLPIHEMSDEVAIMVKKVERLGGNITRVEFSGDKRPAMEMMAKYHNLYENHQQSGAMVVHMDEKDAEA